MKWFMQLLFFSTLIFLYTPISSKENFNITVKPNWCNLDTNCIKPTDFGGKWILIGSITFKKRSKDPVSIENITLNWKGETIDNLIGSLYKKSPDKDFVPIESNLVCDGIWNKNKQQLILNFDEKENLGPTTIFCLVLTVPVATEMLLKNGHFSIEEETLPKAFKHCAQHEKLSLCINDTNPKNSSSITSLKQAL